MQIGNGMKYFDAGRTTAHLGVVTRSPESHRTNLLNGDDKNTVECLRGLF
jgi:hypothetical protein